MKQHLQDMFGISEVAARPRRGCSDGTRNLRQHYTASVCCMSRHGSVGHEPLHDAVIGKSQLQAAAV